MLPLFKERQQLLGKDAEVLLGHPVAGMWHDNSLNIRDNLLERFGEHILQRRFAAKE